ncbi:MAG TPA: Hsp20/alpha crystallin family protein [Acidimicrobiia bacterium]|nr:Hsp20/alpha crystallin family protein [Acidimicrobiia bacterium]
MLVQFDRYGEADRLATALFGTPRPSTRLSMDAVQRADHVELRCDLPGIDIDSIDIQVDGDVLTVRAERRIRGTESDRALELECARGILVRDVRLADSLDPSHYDFEYRDGVLALRVPMVVREVKEPERLF